MGTKGFFRQRASKVTASDLDAALARIAEMSIDELRETWRLRAKDTPPPALSKDLIARLLAHQLQEEVLGGLGPRLRKLLLSAGKGGKAPARRIKIGSVVVRQYQGKLHEVLVVPGGFCWQGQTYPSLSTIARKITGVSWNGPRFFGLRGGAAEADSSANEAAEVSLKQSSRGAARPRGSVVARYKRSGSGGAP
jgi:hypothetical protein